MEQRSFRKYDIFTLVHSFRSVMHYLFKFGIRNRLKIHIFHIHDNVESNEMHYAVRDGMLERKHVNIHVLAK